MQRSNLSQSSKSDQSFPSFRPLNADGAAAAQQPLPHCKSPSRNEPSTKRCRRGNLKTRNKSGHDKSATQRQMIKPPRTAAFVFILLGLLVVATMIYALVVSKGELIFPIRVSIHNEPVIDLGARVWVSALEQQLSPTQFEAFVNAHPQDRDYALGLFASMALTNHVRILIRHGADTSAEALEALNFSGFSNAVSLIRWVVNDSTHTPPTNSPDSR